MCPPEEIPAPQVSNVHHFDTHGWCVSSLGGKKRADCAHTGGTNTRLLHFLKHRQAAMGIGRAAKKTASGKPDKPIHPECTWRGLRATPRAKHSNTMRYGLTHAGLALQQPCVQGARLACAAASHAQTARTTNSNKRMQQVLIVCVFSPTGNSAHSAALHLRRVLQHSTAAHTCWPAATPTQHCYLMQQVLGQHTRERNACTSVLQGREGNTSRACPRRLAASREADTTYLEQGTPAAPAGLSVAKTVAAVWYATRPVSQAALTNQLPKGCA